MTGARADKAVRPWLIGAGAVAGGLALLGLGWLAVLGVSFASETSRGTWTAEERAAFEARVDTYTAFDAQGREITLSYLDGEPSSITVHTGPGTSEQRLVAHGAAFVAYTETGEPWVRPDADAAQAPPGRP